MKKSLTQLLIVAFTLLIGHNTTTWAQKFNPAPIDGYRISFTTTLAIGSKLPLALLSLDADAWIDLNGDKVYQKGEELVSTVPLEVPIQTQKLVIYGDLGGLNISNGQVANVTLEHAPNLIWLRCKKNNLTTLDLGHTPKMKELDCSSNQLRGLEFSKVSDLTRLTCYDNQINESSMQTLIESLPTPNGGGAFHPVAPSIEGGDANICTPKQVTLAEGKNWSVKDNLGKDFPGIGAEAKYMPAPVNEHRISFTTKKPVGGSVTIKVQAQKDHVWIDLNGDNTYQESERLKLDEKITIEIQHQTSNIYGKLTGLECESNEFSELRLTFVPFLGEIHCAKNALTHIDFGAEMYGLYHLSCSENQLPNLDLSRTPILEKLYCDSNQITSLDLGELPELQSINCANNRLSSLNLSKTRKLLQLHCHSNLINEAAMQMLIESLPVVPSTDKGYFCPVDLKAEGGDKNVCTERQVKRAHFKNWKVFDREGNPFRGINGLQELSSSQLPIKTYSTAGILHISGLEVGVSLVVYALDGTIQHQSVVHREHISITLPSGSYVLRIGDYSTKTILY